MRLRFITAIAAVPVFVLAYAVIDWKPLRPIDTSKSFRIGFGNDPPFHYPGADNQPTGLAVEVVKEAARRRGIRLEWVRTTNGYREIVDGRIDLHVLISALPERSKFVYLARPYLSTETCFLVPEASRYRNVQDLSAARIANNGLPLHQTTLKKLLPGSTSMRFKTTAEAVRAIDEGVADVAYVDQFAGISALLEGTAKSPLRIVPSTVPARALTLTSSYATQGVADALREEIGLLSERGELGPILARWSLFPALMGESPHALDLERTKVKALTTGASALLVVLAVVAWLLWHLRRSTYALRVSEVRYRSVVENLWDGVVTVDAEGRFLLSNPAAEGLLGVLPGGLTGRKLVEFLVSEAGQSGPFPELQGSQKLRFQTTLLRPDGTTRKIRVTFTPQFDPGGERAGALVVMGTVTGAHELEEQLRLLAQALRCADDCVSITDPQDCFLYVNEAFLRTYGYEKQEVLGKHVSFVAAESRQAAPEFLSREHWRGELWQRAKTGREFLISLTTARVRDEEGDAVGLISVAQDITELKQAEAERLTLQEQLTQAQKLESLGRLAGGVAHDFNNLLTVINGYSDLLLHGDPPRETYRKRLEQIRQAGRRAAELTHQLLAFGRKQMVQPKVLDLNQLVLETEQMIQRLLPENIEIVTRLDASLDTVEADPSQIHQILLNLVLNARDAMPEGGRLTLETTNAIVDAAFAARHPEVKPGHYVQLRVSDSGVGMDETVLANVFEPFFTTKDLGAGTGLGLATVYGIVQQSGGGIWVESEPGKGTTFRIYMPSGKREDGTGDGDQRGSQAGGGRETILLAEDQDEVRSFVKEVLEEHGYRVLDAPNCVAALELAARHTGPIQLLLTDVIMPGHSGRELAKRLTVTRPETLILYMSGYTENMFSQESDDREEIAFLQKPVSPEALLLKVREVLLKTANRGG